MLNLFFNSLIFLPILLLNQIVADEKKLSSFARNGHPQTFPDNGQFQNLNLNANGACVRIPEFCNKSFSSDNKKICNKTYNEAGETRGCKSRSCNIKSDKVDTPRLNPIKNSKNNIKINKENSNSSTLSLHISAYENAVKDDARSSSTAKNNSAMIKKWKDAKYFFPHATTEIQNPFEISRQQVNQKTEPEIMQFKTSQRLLNLNGSTTNLQEQQHHQNITELDPYTLPFIHETLKDFEKNWENIHHHFEPGEMLGEEDITNYIRLLNASSPNKKKFAWLLTEAAGMTSNTSIRYRTFLENFDESLTEVLLVPHLYNGHFTLWFYYIQQNKLEYFDSFNNPPCNELKTKIRLIIDNIFHPVQLPDTSLVLQKIPNVMQQIDGFNCAVISMDIIKYKLTGKKFPALSYDANQSRTNIFNFFTSVKATNNIDVSFFYDTQEIVKIPPLLPERNLKDEYVEVLLNNSQGSEISREQCTTDYQSPKKKFEGDKLTGNHYELKPTQNKKRQTKGPNIRGRKKARFQNLSSGLAAAAVRQGTYGILNDKKKAAKICLQELKTAKALPKIAADNVFQEPVFIPPSVSAQKRKSALKRLKINLEKKSTVAERLKFVRKSRNKEETLLSHSPPIIKDVPIVTSPVITKRPNPVWKATKNAEKELQKNFPGHNVKLKIVVDETVENSKLIDLKLLVNRNFKKRDINSLSKENKTHAYSTLMRYAEKILPKIPDVKCKPIEGRKNLIFKDFYLFVMAILNVISNLPSYGPIRITISGDKGEKTTKLCFSFVDVKLPQSPANYYTFCMYDGDDCRKNLTDILQHVNEAIEKLQKEGVMYKGERRDVLFFLSGDCKFLCDCCGCQGGNAIRFCLFCQTTSEKSIGILRTVQNIAADWMKIFTDYSKLVLPAQDALNKLKRKYNSVNGPCLLSSIPISRVVPPPLHICMSMVNKFKNHIDSKFFDEFIADLKLEPVQGRKEFNGNSCRKIIHKFRTHPNEYHGPHKNIFLWMAKVESYAVARPLSENEIDDLEHSIGQLFAELDKCKNFQAGNKLHKLRFHVVPFVRLYGSWGSFGEQGQEANHPVVNEKKGRIIAAEDDFKKNKFAFDRLFMNSYVQHL